MMPSPRSRAQSGGPAALVLLWLLAWLGGFPIPGADDAFFSGAAIHLARTGILANPWIVGWMGWIPGVHFDRFYVHPPFLPWTMAAWLKVFGVSARSLTAFACAAGLAAALAMFALARRLGVGAAAAFLAAALISCQLLNRGLRPEAAGLAVLLAGQALMLGPGRLRWFLGAFLTCLAPGFHPFLAMVGMAAILMQGLAAARREDLGRWPLLLASLAGAAIAAALVLLAAIRGEFGAFLHDFLGHSRLVTPGTGRRLARFRETLFVGYEGVPNALALLLSAAAIAAALRSAGRSRAVRLLAGLLVLVLLGIRF
ncbi:MAG TPA: glycosyltransferase family 39 protein, partial [Opitutaceae bacterium]|nr:glycosyltransferase family 39 protein [Opitutaceae bacterium]